MKKSKPIKAKYVRTKKRARRVRNGMSVPCPNCGSPSKVYRTSLGERLRTSRRRRDFVVRERICLSPARHRFHTEEHAR